MFRQPPPRAWHPILIMERSSLSVDGQHKLPLPGSNWQAPTSAALRWFGCATTWLERPLTDSEPGHRRSGCGDNAGPCTPHNAGSVLPTIDVTARKPRYYGHFSEPILGRDFMCEKTFGEAPVSEHEGSRTEDVRAPQLSGIVPTGVPDQTIERCVRRTST